MHEKVVAGPCHACHFSFLWKKYERLMHENAISLHENENFATEMVFRRRFMGNLAIHYKLMLGIPIDEHFWAIFSIMHVNFIFMHVNFIFIQENEIFTPRFCSSIKIFRIGMCRRMRRIRNFGLESL